MPLFNALLFCFLSNPSGGLLYDNLKSKVSSAACEDFKAFFAEDSVLSAQSTTGSATQHKGPASHKVSLNPVEFIGCLETRNWSRTDEHYMRESFWGSSEFSLHKKSFEEQIDAALVPGLSKLFCSRVTACKPLYQCVGILDKTKDCDHF